MISTTTPVCCITVWQVHPVTGHVFINTIKGYAQFTTNQIWEFDFKANAETPVAKYENYTHFPAGFFFAPNNN